jgi:hypothetical protein
MQHLVVEAIPADPRPAIWRTELIGGFRPGEFPGLRWCFVDIGSDAPSIHVVEGRPSDQPELLTKDGPAEDAYIRVMSEPAAHKPDPDPDQPPVTRDLAEDEPDLPSDQELQDMAPPLPDLRTDPVDPLTPVPPGPESAVSPLPEAAGSPEGSLEEMARAVEEGRLPE